MAGGGDQSVLNRPHQLDRTFVRPVMVPPCTGRTGPQSPLESVSVREPVGHRFNNASAQAMSRSWRMRRIDVDDGLSGKRERGDSGLARAC